MSYIGNESSYSVTTGPISTRGRHLLLELHGCERGTLVDAVALERVLRRAAELANVQVMCMCFHQFPAGGITGVLVLAESHISIHTWPEHNMQRWTSLLVAKDKVWWLSEEHQANLGSSEGCLWGSNAVRGPALVVARTGTMGLTGRLDY